MDSRHLLLSAIVLAVCLTPLIVDDGSEASNPGWREPPEVPSENIFSFTFGSEDEPLLTSSPAQSVTFHTSNLEPKTDAYNAAWRIAAALQNSGSWSIYESDDILPSWITYESSYTGASWGGLTFEVYPAAQVEGEHSTYGTYWLYLVPGGSESYKFPYLFVFNVYVDWDGDGGVITPPEDETVYFRLVLDYCQPDLSDTMLVKVSNASSVSASFTLPIDVDDREGLVFSGWSLTDGGVAAFNDRYTVAVGADNVSVTEEGGVTYYTATLYASWQPAKVTFPSMWDELSVLLSDPMVLLILAIGFLSVCLFIRNRTGGGY